MEHMLVRSHCVLSYGTILRVFNVTEIPLQKTNADNSRAWSNGRSIGNGLVKWTSLTRIQSVLNCGAGRGNQQGRYEGTSTLT